jgi:hypothetical protein
MYSSVIEFSPCPSPKAGQVWQQSYNAGFLTRFLSVMQTALPWPKDEFINTKGNLKSLHLPFYVMHGNPLHTQVTILEGNIPAV